MLGPSRPSAGLQPVLPDGALSRAEEVAVKHGLRGRLRTLVHRTNWRMTFAPWADLVVYDPNDPSAPGVVRFDHRDARFHPAPLCGVTVPVFRAFRQYYSPLF